MASADIWIARILILTYVRNTILQYIYILLHSVYYNIFFVGVKRIQSCPDGSAAEKARTSAISHTQYINGDDDEWITKYWCKWMIYSMYVVYRIPVQIYSIHYIEKKWPKRNNIFLREQIFLKSVELQILI